MLKKFKLHFYHFWGSSHFYFLERRVIYEKYYINTDRARNLIEQLVEKGQLHGDRETCDSTILDHETREICNCITARYDASIQNQRQIGMCVAEPVQKRLGGLFDDEKGKHQAGSVWSSDDLAPTLDTCQGGYREPCVVIGSTQDHAYVGNGEMIHAATEGLGVRKDPVHKTMIFVKSIY
mgnify:CR=1 FL=1